MTTEKTKRHLRAVTRGEGAQDGEEGADHSGEGTAARDGLRALSAPQSDGRATAGDVEVAMSPSPHVNPQVNRHDAKLWEGRVNELLAAISARGAMIPPTSMDALRGQAQAVAALRLLVNRLGVPEAEAQVAVSQALHEMLSAILAQVEASADPRQRAGVQPVRGQGLILPGRQ